MSTHIARKLIFTGLIALVAVAIAIVAMKREGLVLLQLHSLVHPYPTAGSHSRLNDYRVSVDARPIAGITDLSGLTFNSETGTLFSVLNNRPVIVELDRNGALIREITVSSVDDMEGITHIESDLFALADERNNTLYLARITAESRHIELDNQPKLSLALQGRKNKGFEGISWDENRQRLLIVEEREPIRVLEITGFVDGSSTPSAVIINQLDFDKHRLWLRDLSSITHERDTDSVLLLSDESRLVIEYDSQGRTASYLSLWGGAHGLVNDIPQAEGIAIGSDGEIYIVSEPNLFYVFTPAD